MLNIGYRTRQEREACASDEILRGIHRVVMGSDWQDDVWHRTALQSFQYEIVGHREEEHWPTYRQTSLALAYHMAAVTGPTLHELWMTATLGTGWERLDVRRELEHIERLAVRPRLPWDHLIFRLFKVFKDPAAIRVVLLGQDPYPEIVSSRVPKRGAVFLEEDDEEPEEVVEPVPRACGFAFSSPLGKLPLSLRTIITKILVTYPQDEMEIASPAKDAAPDSKITRKPITSDYSGDLSYLLPQGVFLLNTMLTIELDEEKGSGRPRTHTSWLPFTHAVLTFIARSFPYTVAMALGRDALRLCEACFPKARIMSCDHPAAGRFGGGKNSFKESNIFAEVDQASEKFCRHSEVDHKPIDWVPLMHPIDTRYFVRPVPAGTSQ